MKKELFKRLVLSIVVAIGVAGPGFAADRSIGIGNISVFKEDKLVSKLMGQNPIEDGALLVCNGQCLIKSKGIRLIGQDKAQLTVASAGETFQMYVKEGQVDYIVDSNARKIKLRTRHGDYTLEEVVFKGKSQSAEKGFVVTEEKDDDDDEKKEKIEQSLVKGSIFVTESGHTEITVTQGRLYFVSDKRRQIIDVKNRIVLTVRSETVGSPGLITEEGAVSAGAETTASKTAADSSIGTKAVAGAETVDGVGVSPVGRTQQAGPVTHAGTEPGASPGTGPVGGPGTETAGGPGTETVPGQGPETVPGQGSETVPGQGPQTAQGPGTERTQGLGSETAQGPGSETVPGQGSETVPGQGPETAQGPGTERTQGLGSETAQGSGSETVSGQGSETVPGQGPETAQGPGSETVPGQGPEAAAGAGGTVPGVLTAPVGGAVAVFAPSAAIFGIIAGDQNNNPASPNR